MRVLKNVRRVHIIVILAVIVYSIALVNITQAVAGSAEPGSEANPLVAQDYVDARIAELNSQIEELTKASKFEAVQIKAGKQLVAGASTEIVLRSGKAAAVVSANGGLSDLIAGNDIPAGGNIPLNHLILIPRDDGRGFKTVSDVWILIKGTYTIK